jgi:hypothetical protein
MYKLKFNFHHIGDQISTTSIPENVFNVTGKKCVITDKRIWAFEHNPYVHFLEEEDAIDLPEISLIPDCRVQEQVKHFHEKMQTIVAGSQAEYMCVNLGFSDVRLRHPRLYIHEDVDIIPNKIVVHTTGSDRTRDKEPAIRTSSGEDAVRVMSDDVIANILRNYKDYQIIQLGGKDDKLLGGHSVDMRGKLSLFDVAKEIASSARFIGVNSGLMHIANCYPRVDKRIVLMEFPRETLMTFKPCDIRNWLFSWIDISNVFFNKFEHDVGLTYSYTKI